MWFHIRTLRARLSNHYLVGNIYVYTLSILLWLFALKMKKFYDLKNRFLVKFDTFCPSNLMNSLALASLASLSTPALPRPIRIPDALEPHVSYREITIIYHILS